MCQGFSSEATKSTRCTTIVRTWCATIQWSTSLREIFKRASRGEAIPRAIERDDGKAESQVARFIMDARDLSAVKIRFGKNDTNEGR